MIKQRNNGKSGRCDGHLNKTTQKNHIPDFNQVLDGKFQPDGKHQQNHPDFGHQFQFMF